jgi:hypothetical protein
MVLRNYRLKSLCIILTDLQVLFHGRCEEVGFAVPAPIVTYATPLPAIHFGPATAILLTVPRPAI